MSEGVVVPTFTSDPTVDFYTDLSPLNGDNFLPLSDTIITISGLSDDLVPGDDIITYLIPYAEGQGRAEAGSTAVAATSPASLTATGLVDTDGDTLVSYSTTISIAGLAPGLYEAVSIEQLNNRSATEYADGGAGATQIVSIGTTQAAAAPLVFSGTSASLTTDGRYLVYTAIAEYNRPEIDGHEYEYDLQTGAEVDLTATGGTPAGTFAVNHYATAVTGNGANYFVYPSFVAGGYTFGTIVDFNQNQAQGGYDPLPTVTDAAGEQVLTGFGGALTVAGALAASDNGNVLLSDQPYDNRYDSAGSANDLETDPLIYISYLSPAPRLTLNEVNGTDQIKAGDTEVTLSGTSDAIGQTVQIDLGAAGVDSGSATVAADGNWSFTFDASGYATGALYIEASVTNANGTPAEVNETAQITTAVPDVTSITGTLVDDETTFGPGQTLTIALDTSAPVFVTGTPELELNNGEAATYASGSGTDQLVFTYVPGMQDQSSADLSVTGLLQPNGATINDAEGDALAGPFDQDLGLSLQSAPVIVGLDPASDSNVFLTNSDMPVVEVGAERGETITLYDNGIEVGTGLTPDYGVAGITYAEITLTSVLPEGQSTLTANGVANGISSTYSAPAVITVDTALPAESITSMAVNGTDVVSLADQASLNVVITGALSAALQSGDSIVVALPDGETEQATASGTAFTLTLSSFEAEGFGVSGSISAYIENAAGNNGPTISQSFKAVATHAITLVTSAPTDPVLARDEDPALSGNGQFIAFESGPQNGGEDAIVESATSGISGSITSGIYIEDLATGTVSLAVAGAESAALSNSGTILAYAEDDSNFVDQIYVKNLSTGTTTLISADGNTGGDQGSDEPAISADGNTVVFASSADDLVSGANSYTFDAQIYEATLSDGTLTGVTLLSAAAAGAGDGDSSGAAISADGSTTAFLSDDTDLLAAGDPHTANLGGFDDQLYVKALTANAAAGLQAGQVVLVSGLADGTVGDGESSDAVLSSNGQYVAFLSNSDNLAPANLAAGATLPAETTEVYVKNLATGVITLVSQTPDGVIGDFSATSVAISADGSTVVFSDSADNLGGGSLGGQVYVAKFADGQVSSLSLLSEPGAIPGDDESRGVAVSADGTETAFESEADNLASGTSGGFNREHVYATGTGVAPPHAPTIFTVTTTADSGTGSLRAALAGADSGDTIIFASTLAGGTISLASSLSVTDGVTISGTGDNITLDGGGKVTDLTIDNHSGAAVSISGLTIANGNGNGTGTIGVDDTADTTDGGAGGAAAGGILLQAGALDLASDSFTANTATGGNGGAGTWYGGVGGGAGGAVYVAAGAALTASNLIFTGNSAAAGVGGEGNVNGSSSDSGGSGGNAAGAIYIADGDTAVLNGLSFASNTGTGGAAGADYYEKGAGGYGGAAAGAVYAGIGANIAASGLSFTSNTATGGMGGPINGDLPNNDQLGYKGAGYGGSAAGAVFVNSGTAITPVDFTYTGNAATAGFSGDGKPDTVATAFADTDIKGSNGATAVGGSAQDGYIIGGTVSYVNGSGGTATTGADGSFTLTGGTGAIMLTGGTDNASGLLFGGTLTAPAGSTILSPLTTLIEAVAVAGSLGTDAAGTLVADVLQLPSGTDLTQYDAEGGLLTAASGSSALEFSARVFAAGNYLQSLEQLITAADGNVTLALATVAQEIAAGDAIDLTDPATLIDAAGLSSAASAALLSMADTVITAVENHFTGATAPLTMFDDITGGAIAIQQDAVQAITSSSDITSAASTFDSDINQILSTDDAIAVGNNAPCYCKGTMIETIHGKRAVEDLRIGDLVITQSGAAQPIKWLGRRRYLGRFIKGNHLMLPVRIAPDALGDNIPSRDLYVSPGHALCIDHLLIPAWRLVNGVTITQAADVEEVSYFHIELDAHDIILAEDCPAESYLADMTRAQFQNFREFERLYPDAVVVQTCLPRIECGRALLAIQRRLARRAGLVHRALAPGPLRGFIDQTGPLVTGWAQDLSQPEEPVMLDIFVDARWEARVLANAYRADLRAARLGSGTHAFAWQRPGAALGSIEIRRCDDGANLGFSGYYATAIAG